MRILCIAVQGDNDHLHQDTLRQLVEQVPQINSTNMVYRAWIENPGPNGVGEVDRKLDRVREL